MDHKQTEPTVKYIEQALEWLGRKYIIIDANGKNLRQIGKTFPYESCNSYGEFYSILQYYLLKTDYVIIFKEFSQSKIKVRKAVFIRSLIKLLDDAHFDKINPLSDLIIIDHATFLAKSWADIGPYLEIMVADFR